MGQGASKDAGTPWKSRPAVPEGKTRICVIGFRPSHHTGHALTLARTIVAKHPEAFETWFYIGPRGKAYSGEGSALADIKAELPAVQREKFAAHKTSPFCWLETSGGPLDAKGGRDNLGEWAKERFKDDTEIVAIAEAFPKWREAFFDKASGTANPPPAEAAPADDVGKEGEDKAATAEMPEPAATTEPAAAAEPVTTEEPVPSEEPAAAAAAEPESAPAEAAAAATVDGNDAAAADADKGEGSAEAGPKSEANE